MLTVILLGLTGLCLGSFVNALVWRVHEQAKVKNKPKFNSQPKKLSVFSHKPLVKGSLDSGSRQATQYSVLTGRSMCPNCRHELSARDLIPVLSWVLLRGRCRYCKKPISIQYPIVELVTACVFVLSYIFWPQTLNSGQSLIFVTWLICLVGLMALLVYDYKWMLLPNKILYPTLMVAFTGRSAYIALYAPDIAFSLKQLLFGLVVASGIFWILFEVSKGRWIGFGDVRLGLISGSVLAEPTKSMLMIFIASLLGSLFALITAFGRRSAIPNKIAFGPFLISATFLVMLFGDIVINWYKNLLI